MHEKLKALFFIFVSVAYLGDIALDEEDMRMFKVDRIVNLAERTVTILNHTNTGKCVCASVWVHGPALYKLCARLNWQSETQEENLKPYIFKPTEKSLSRNSYHIPKHNNTLQLGSDKMTANFLIIRVKFHDIFTPEGGKVCRGGEKHEMIKKWEQGTDFNIR